MTISVSRKFACDEVVRLTDERDAPAAKRSGRVSEANCEAAARPRAKAKHQGERLLSLLGDLEIRR